MELISKDYEIKGKTLLRSVLLSDTQNVRLKYLWLGNEVFQSSAIIFILNWSVISYKGCTIGMRCLLIHLYWQEQNITIQYSCFTNI